MSTVVDRTLPANLDAERSILGAILVDNRALDDLTDTLAPETFYREAHKRLFAAMVRLYTKNEPVEFVTLKAELARVGDLEECGGPAYLASLSEGVPKSTNVRYYARLVKEAASRRRVIELANQLMADAYEAETEAAALVDQAERGLLAISQDAVPGDLVSAEEMVRNIYPVLEELTATRRPVTGLSTGFRELDRYTRGLQPGNLVILGGRPSQGKSTIAIQIALHIAQSLPVAFFSVEMSQQEQVFRVLATLAEVDGHQLQCGQLSMIDQQRLGPALTAFTDRKFWLDDSGTISALQIRSKARRLKARVGLGLIVVDYIQLMTHPRTEARESREQQVAATSRILKHIARELHVPVIALCQLNRAAEQRTDKRPNLSDLRESGSLEQDADLVLLIHRPPVKQAGVVQEIPATELIVAKQRNGPTTSIDLRFYGEQYRFVEIEGAA